MLLTGDASPSLTTVLMKSTVFVSTLLIDASEEERAKA